MISVGVLAFEGAVNHFLDSLAYGSVVLSIQVTPPADVGLVCRAYIVYQEPDPVPARAALSTDDQLHVNYEDLYAYFDRFRQFAIDKKIIPEDKRMKIIVENVAVSISDLYGHLSEFYGLD